MGWEYVSIIFDVFVCLFDGVVLKGRLPEEQSVHDDSY